MTLTDDSSQDIVLHPSVAKLIWFCVFSAVMAAAGAAALIIALKWPAALPGIEILVVPGGIAAALFGLGFCVICLMMLTYRKWYLRVDDSGLVIVSPFNEIALPWECIASFAIIELEHGVRVVGYTLVDDYPEKHSRWGRTLTGCDGARTLNYGVSVVELHRLLSARLRMSREGSM